MGVHATASGMMNGIGGSLQPVFALRATPGTLRSSGSCVAAPRVARRAKRGARRDRTADLLHAMQALSQLSYGPSRLTCAPWATRGRNPEHSSGPISSLFVAADVADDVGNVLVAFFLVGDEGGIVIVFVFDGLVDLDVVFGLGN